MVLSPPHMGLLALLVSFTGNRVYISTQLYYIILAEYQFHCFYWNVQNTDDIARNSGKNSERPTPPLVEEKTQFPNTQTVFERTFGHGSQRGPKLRTTVLARPSSNLLIRDAFRQTQTHRHTHKHTDSQVIS
jgi:hypothetical protein